MFRDTLHSLLHEINGPVITPPNIEAPVIDFQERRSTTASPAQKMTLGEAEVPEEFRQEYNDRVLPLFTQRRMLNRDYREDHDNAQRAEIAKQLAQVQAQINDFYDRVREFLATGQTRRRGKRLFQQYLDADREVSRLREKISRTRKTNPDLEAALISEKEAAMMHVESLANQLHELG